VGGWRPTVFDDTSLTFVGQLFMNQQVQNLRIRFQTREYLQLKTLLDSSWILTADQVRAQIRPLVLVMLV